MTTQAFYHDGHRQLQDAFASRGLADRPEAVTLHREFTDADRDLIESAAFFLLATADSTGQPDCTFKGGMPGFVRVIGRDELAFPDYDGNGMFRSLGSIRVNPSVGLLFIAMGDQPRRLRVNGTARIARDDADVATFTGTQMLVRVTVRTGPLGRRLNREGFAAVERHMREEGDNLKALLEADEMPVPT
jgi:uncharacterized protein